MDLFKNSYLFNGFRWYNWVGLALVMTPITGALGYALYLMIASRPEFFAIIVWASVSVTLLLWGTHRR
jgi:hypothetical protein